MAGTFRPAAGTSWLRLGPDWQRAEVADEPVSGQFSGRGEGSWFLEQVGGTGYHGDLVMAPQLYLGIAVEVEHEAVQSSDDEKRRRGDGREPGTG
jgi:hypothetical protein